MRQLSKSKLIAYRQCGKRLWLEVHRPELKEDSQATQASYADGHNVGELAQKLYDPQGKGQVLDPHREGWQQAFARTQELLQGDAPIFEASFSIQGALSLADVLLPVFVGKRKAWRMIEIKASTQLKAYHQDDVAIQTHVAKRSGLDLHSVALAHVNNQWVYPGGGNYDGILVEDDLTPEAFARTDEVQTWIGDAQQIVRQAAPPDIAMGDQCNSPFACGFQIHCQAGLPVAEFPVSWLPRVQRKDLKAYLKEANAPDMRDVPDQLLNPTQLRVKQSTVNGEPYWDPALALSLLQHQNADKPPVWFLDFETIQFAIPIWKGTRPYQQMPFQFSCHELTRSGELRHTEFLDLSGEDPSRALAQALIESCGTAGPIFAYNASFEVTRIKELAARFDDLGGDLMALTDRVVDLRPIAEKTFYHPSQEGSWSIKMVLPAVFPQESTLSYDDLVGVQDGGGAIQAYTQAISPQTNDAERSEIDQQLRKYCQLDTYAMVRLWQFFCGREVQKCF